MRGVEDVEVYIDDIGAFSNSWEDHCTVLSTVLRRLCENGFTINPLKCKWAVKETDCLGYWLTPRGLKPWRKKIDAILHMDRPKTPKELRKFIGMVNYYRDMWPSRAHILKPLTDKSGLKKGQRLDWTDEMQAAFDKMKLLLAADALAAFPDHISDLTFTLTLVITSLVLAFAKMAVLLLILARNCLNHSEIILQWKRDAIHRCYSGGIP